MFEKARIKLTAWYLIIIMTVSFAFSGFIYTSVTLEFQRRLNIIENRFSVETPQGWRAHGPVHDYFVADLEAAREKVLLMLVYSNAVVFIFSSAAGYFLAGLTLSPIEKAMNEQKRFVADASHELKTPLTSLQTSIEVALRDKRLDLKSAKKTLTESLTDIESLKLLTNNLLLLAKYQQNGSAITKERLDLKAVLSASIKKVSPIASSKKIKIVNKVKSFFITADRISMETLFTNLLENAIKYTQQGKVTISVSATRRHVITKIQDTGVGISEKDIPYIFDRFYQADSARTKTKETGSGVGLSIAQEIANIHGGKIEVKSKIGIGSTFIVHLPR